MDADAAPIAADKTRESFAGYSNLSTETITLRQFGWCICGNRRGIGVHRRSPS